MSDNIIDKVKDAITRDEEAILLKCEVAATKIIIKGLLMQLAIIDPINSKCYNDTINNI